MGVSKMMRLWVIMTLLVSGIVVSRAQDSTQTPQKWRFLVEPYLMGPNMKGTVGIGSLPDVDVNANVGDIFSHLKAGFMLYAEAQNGTWALSSDFLYMKLSQDAEPTKLINSGNVTVSETAWELAGLRTLLPWLEGGVAGRMLRIDMDADVVRNEPRGGTTPLSEAMTRTWFDPLFLFRLKLANAGHWQLQLRADIGGFGIGSDLTWQVQAYAGYRFSELFQATVGYRSLAIDYEKGEGADRFKYDVTTFGPIIKLGFNF
jgi:hypothetical protein